MWYGGGRYARMTFRPFSGLDRVREVEAATVELAAALMWPDEPKIAPQAAPRPAPATPLPDDDTELRACAFAANDGGSLARRHRGEYLIEDESEDD